MGKHMIPETKLYHEIYDLAEEYGPELLFEAAARIVLDFIEAAGEMLFEEKES